MGGSNFDPLLEELQQLQHVMQELERTNRELRLQLANLRMGKGIIVDIAGKRFVLSSEATTASPDIEAQPKPQITTMATAYNAIPSTRKTTLLPPAELMVEEQATVATLATPSGPQEIPAATFSASGPQEIPAATFSPSTANEEEATFLEEIMYDEFANQMTSPLAVWTGPVKKPLNPDEEEKAALRRELMGSFLLE